MIYVKRPNDPGLAVYLASLPGVPTPSEAEVAAAIAFFTDKANYSGNTKVGTAKFSFKVYKDPSLGDKLEEVFNGKCAYCESHYRHVAPKDIEHFRPKSEILHADGTKTIPGYFWLGCEWTNLLNSCLDCNRMRKHNVPGQTAKAKLGKGAQFPLDDEKKRVRKHRTDLASEDSVRLLINPCRDKPETLLVFDDDALVRPVFPLTTFNGRKGKTSIDVYALQRKGLVEMRKLEINRFIAHIATMRYLLLQHNELVADKSSRVKIDMCLAEIQRVGAQLRIMTAPSAPYIAMLRSYITRGVKSGAFDDMKRLGVDLLDLV